MERLQKLRWLQTYMAFNWCCLLSEFYTWSVRVWSSDVSLSTEPRTRPISSGQPEGKKHLKSNRLRHHVSCENVTEPTCSFSHTFFFGFSFSSALPDSYPSTKTCSPGDDPSGGSRGSTLLGSPSLSISRWEKEGESEQIDPRSSPLVSSRHSHWGTQQHGLRLNPSHLLGLQVAQHQHHSVLQFLLRNIGHQPTDHRPGLCLTHVDLLQVQSFSIWMLGWKQK